MTQVYAQGDAGIGLSNECLTDGSCTLSIYETLQIREESQENNLETLVQDTFLAATFFVGTMAAIGLIISGLVMVFGGADESMYEKGKKGFKYSVIGLLLVIFSYTIIRFVQWIAQGNS